MLAMLIQLNKIPQIMFMAAFATSLLSILDPNNNFEATIGLELGLGLGLGLESGVELGLEVGVGVGLGLG